MASWGEDLKAYEASKQSLPAAFLSAEPVQRITRRGGGNGGGGLNSSSISRKMAREYDILSNTALTREAEASFQQSKEETQRKQREKAFSQRLKTTQHNYNILTMEMLEGAGDGKSSPHVKGNQPLRGKMVFKDGTSFISTAQYALEPDAWISPPPTPRTAAKKERALARAEDREREYNIVTQEYRKDHEVKAEADREAELLRVNAAAMMSMSERYNPLTCKFRHVDDEAKAKEEEEAKKHKFKIAELVRNSDGGAYNILSNTVKDADLATKYEKAALRGVTLRSIRRKEWEKQRDSHEDASDLAKERSLNRVNRKQRDAEALSHGYDILCNRPFATSIGQDSANPERLKIANTMTPLEAFNPTSTAQLVQTFSSSFGSQTQQNQQKYAPRKAYSASTAEPRSSFERLFCHPSREAAAKEVQIGETIRKEEFDRQRLPSIGSGVVQSLGWDPSPQAQMQRTAAASARPAGGAANLLMKNEMGTSGLKRVAGASTAAGSSSHLHASPSERNDRRVSGAGAAGNNVSKTQLKPLVTRNLLMKSDPTDGSSLRSFF